jgi:hypothetical protein
MASLPPFSSAETAPRLIDQPMTPEMGPGNGLDSLDGMARALGPVPPKEPRQEPIDKLRPGSELHGKVLDKLRAMFKYSRDEMTKHHARWNWMEHKIQAYLMAEDYAEQVRIFNNNRGAPPEPVKVVVPYTYATIHAAATFLASVLLGRRPIFPLMATGGSTVEKARYMEQALQANIEASKGYEVLWQFIWDSLVYSFGVVRIGWKEEYGKSFRIVDGQRSQVEGLKYAGNALIAVDPYSFYPDPRVPIHEVSRRGDFVFWEVAESKLSLEAMAKAKDSDLRWVKEGLDKNDSGRVAGELPAVSDSRRRARLGTAGDWSLSPSNVVGFVMRREGTVWIRPKDWGLSESEDRELWKFSWINDRQIIQAAPLGMAHERHPVATTEPTSFGHEFGSLSASDMITPFQDLISWLVNSRMENVRTTINNQFLVDPARIEMQDLRTPAAGRTIRLKQAAMGLPVQEAFMQLQVQDVTMGHINDIQALRMLADATTGINDNMRGVQTAGGRRSATEARMSMQAGASRLSQMAVRISAQGLTDAAEQMIMNIQQFMPNEMWVQSTGDDGTFGNTLLTPDMILGTFNYQISDGSLPYDKMALLEVWKEVFFGISRDPELRQQYNLGEIFDYMAKLGGAKNIDAFRRQVQQQPNVMAPGQQPPAGAQPVGAATPAAPAGLNPFGAGA